MLSKSPNTLVSLMSSVRSMQRTESGAYSESSIGSHCSLNAAIVIF